MGILIYSVLCHHRDRVNNNLNQMGHQMPCADLICAVMTTHNYDARVLVELLINAFFLICVYFKLINVQ